MVPLYRQGRTGEASWGIMLGNCGGGKEVCQWENTYDRSS